MSDPSSSAAGPPSFTLWAQGQQVALSVGVALQRAQFPMLVPANPGGPVALVNVNPHDPTQLGLQNLTTSAWTATLPDGSQKEIATDKSVRLAAGTVIQAGPLQWEIRAQSAPVAAPLPQAGFVAASEPAIAPQPVMPVQAGFVQAGFVQASAPALPPQAGFVQAGPPVGAGFVPDNAPGQPPRRPGGAARNIIASSSLSFSQIFPVMGERKELMGKGFLIPGAVTALVVALLFTYQEKGDYLHYINVLGAYIGVGLLFAMYRLCGKSKPWWIVAAPVVFTFIFLKSPLWNVIYPLFNFLGEPKDGEGLLPSFFHMTVSVGLREEFTKALPVFALLLIGRKLASPLREKIGVWEPLDGVLFGAASGLGFTMLETLTDYVPHMIAQATQQTGNEGVGAAMGLMLLVPRVLSMLSGHIAWAGYFGYFIGLAAMRPKHAVKLILIGWGTAAVLHGLWDSTSNGLVLEVIECVIFYAFLIAAVLKARQLSPDRAHNFATQVKGI